MIWGFIRDTFGEPSGYEADPSGWINNQAAHFLLGFMACASVAWSTVTLADYWLRQEVVFAIVVGFYALWWEFGYQGWRGLDTLADSGFVAAGAAPWLLIDMQYVIDRVFLFVVILAAALSIGALKRWREMNERH